MNWLINIVGQLVAKKETPSKRRHVTAAIKTVSKPAAHNYPADDLGYPRVTADDALICISDLTSKLKVAVGRQYEARHAPVITALASWVLNLPLTESEEYAQPYGMLRFSIECGFHSQRMAEQFFFSQQEDATKRQQVEDAWCFAAFLVGTFSEISKLTAISVTAPDGGSWECFSNSLDSILDTCNASTFYLSFKPQSDKPEVGTALAQRIIPADLMQSLSDTNPAILRAMFTALEGGEDPASSNLKDVKERSRNAILARERKRMPQQYGRVRQGTHIEPYLVDGLRVCLKSWRINEESGYAWVASDGLYVSRPGVTEIIKELVSRGINAVPAAEETFVEMLVGAGVAVRSADGALFWSVYPGEIATRAMRIPDYSSLFDADAVPPEAVNLTQKKPKPKEPPVLNPDLFSGVQEMAEEPSSVSICNPVELKTTEIVVASESRGKAKAATTTSRKTAAKPSGTETVEENVAIPADIRPRDETKQAEMVKPAETSPQDTLTKPVENATRVDVDTSVETQTEILTAKPVTYQASDLAEKLLRQTHDPAISEFLRAIIQDHNEHNIYGTLWTEHGLAIHKDLIPRYGMDEMSLFVKLHGLMWISENPEKPRQKFLEIAFPDGVARALVLRTLIAQDLGFKR